MADKAGDLIKLPRGYQRKRCSSCHRVRPCAFRPDPMQEELYNDRIRYWLCDDCHSELRAGV